jgi:hypothetical protein
MGNDLAKQWFAVTTNGHRIGPITAARLSGWAEQGSITPESLVWTDGQIDWLPAKETELLSLFSAVKLPPPLTRQRRDLERAELVVPDNLEQSTCAQPPDDLLTGYMGTPEKRQPGLAPNKAAIVSAGFGWLVGALLIAVAVIGGIAGIAKPQEHWWPPISLGLAGVLIIPPVVRSMRVSMPFLKATWAPPLIAFSAFIGTGMFFVATEDIRGRTSFPPSKTSGEPKNEQTEACRFEFVGSGGDPKNYDWSRSYTSDAWPDVDGPVATKIDGERIKCIIVPKVGADTDWSGCGILSAQPKDHWVCRMVFDRRQGIWVSTWKARSS